VALVHELNDEDRSRPALTHTASRGRQRYETRVPQLFPPHPAQGRLRHAGARRVKLKVGYEFDGDDNDYRVVFGRGAVGAR